KISFICLANFFTSSSFSPRRASFAICCTSSFESIEKIYVTAESTIKKESLLAALHLKYTKPSSLSRKILKTAENIKKVALVLFVILGILHILSGLMFANEYLLPTSMIINRVLDIPFAMMAVIYGFMNMYTNMDENSRKIPGIAFLVISVIIFVLLIYINLLI